MVLAVRTVNMGSGCGGHEELSRQNDVSWFALLQEELGESGVIRLDVTDEPSEEPSGLQILPRKGGDKPDDAVQNLRSV